MSDSVQPHRRQPIRLHHPWDSPGKNTGVGCDFLLQCMKVKSESEVAQSCPTLSDPKDCSPPGFLGGSLNLLAMQETQVQFLSWEDPIEEGMEPTPFYFCLENPMDREAWQGVHTHTHIYASIYIYIHIYIYNMNHFTVQLKLTQHCQSTRFQ